MKVTYVHRPRHEGAFSLENEFDSVKSALKGRVDIDEYVHDPRRNLISSVLELRRRKSDVYHVAGDVHYYATFLPRGRTLLTVHDIGHYVHTLRGMRRAIYKLLWLTLPLKAASAITVISDATKAGVAKYFPWCAGKISVIGCPYPENYKFVSRKFNADCPVILQVGTSEYKNVPRLISALKGINCRLVLIGRMTEPILKELKASGTVYENYFNISDAELHSRYIDSDIVSFVSTGEGFGMPIVEANAIGRPLLTSNIPPMADVAGQAACLVDPMDVADIRRGILKIIQSEQYRARLVSEGLENCKRFSANRIAEEYSRLYSKLCANPENS